MSNPNKPEEIVINSVQGPTSFDLLASMLRDIFVRQCRMESRMVKLMRANGLDRNGDPIIDQ